MRSRSLRWSLPAFALVSLLSMANLAQAYPKFNFTYVTGSTTSTNTGGQFELTVVGNASSTMYFNAGSMSNTTSSDSAGIQINTDQVLFVLRNNIGVQSSITDVAFQDGTLYRDDTPPDEVSVFQSTGVVFGTDDGQGMNLADLPQDFKATKAYSFDADKDSKNGINASTEWLAIRWSLQSGKDYDDVIAALIQGITKPGEVWDSKGEHLTNGKEGLRVAIHVQSFPDGNSGKFITSVPEPSTLAIAGIGALGFGAHVARVRRRRGK